MISTLSYRISFPSTGKVFSQNLTFAPGLTVIRGENETGKSLILEMIRYALFGTDALRSTRDQYDILDVNMTFTIKGDEYRVVRTGGKAFLNGKLAVGAAAVNRKIKELLGFDLDVFDLACAAVQGDLDKLTKRMRPGQRRQMVEEVIGLTAIEDEEKECRSSGNEHKRLADAEEKRLVLPEPPQKPDNYESSDTLEELYRRQLEAEAERRQLLRMEEPQMPDKPERPEYDDDVDEHEERRVGIAHERSILQRALREIPAATRTRQDTERALRYWEQQRRGPLPDYPREQLLNWQDAWATLSSVGSLVRCPNCNVEFNPATNSIHELPPEPPISLREVNNQLLAHERWEGFEGEQLIAECDMSEEEAKEQQYALSQASRRDEILNSLGTLSDLPDRSEEANRRRLYLQRAEVYERLCESFGPLWKEWERSRQRLSELPEPDPTLEQRLKDSRWYEEQKRRYDADMKSYTDAMEFVKSERTKAEGYFKASEALKDVRLEAKQHLVPSLSRVASHLLSEMTDGKRTKIVVDEDFDITVDAQPVSTLSGSGVSVVNLALRIALGQVLTQKVVPLFLADEIDHDMDAGRAQATHDSLKKLTKELDKIIVVTHKDIKGDHIIELE